MTEDEVGEVETVGQTEPYENVLDFKSRGKVPWSPEPDPEPTPRERIVGKEIDDGAIELLESLAEDFREGRHHGLVAVIGEFDHRGNLVNYRTVISEVARSYPISFLGAVEQTKFMLSDESIGMNNEGEIPEDDYVNDEDLLSPDD